MGRRLLVVGVVAAVLLVSGAGALADDRSPQVDIYPLGILTDGGNTLEFRGLFQCTDGLDVRLHVRSTQMGGRLADGEETVPCTGLKDRWQIVAVSHGAGGPFDFGPTATCARADTFDGATLVGSREVCKNVRLVASDSESS